jgi:copper chaperone CopZ
MAVSLKMHVATILALSCTIAGCSETLNEAADISRASATSAVFNPTGAPTVKISLPNMMCEDGCALTVRDILVRQPGAKDVKVDFEGKTALVAIDETKFDSDDAIAALVDKGFDHSTIVKADAGSTTVSAESEAAAPPTESASN